MRLWAVTWAGAQGYGARGKHTLQERSVARIKIITPAFLTVKRWSSSPKEMPETENRNGDIIVILDNNVGGVYPV